MKFYNDFSSMFNAQSGVKKDMSVFNDVRLSKDNGYECYDIRPYFLRRGWHETRAGVYVYGHDEDPMIREEPDVVPFTHTLIVTDDAVEASYDLDPITEDDLRDALRSAGYSEDFKVISVPVGGLWVMGMAPLGPSVAERVAEILDDKFGGEYDS